MKPTSTDVDIDVANRDDILQKLECIYGRIDRPDNKIDKHPSGVYFQNIPRDPFTNIATLDHKVANTYGYFKVDFLNVNIYTDIKDESHLLRLLDTPPQWELFEYADITDKLFHLHGYSYLLQRFKPTSVEDLAMILALIRPAKSHLQNASWAKIKEEVWNKDSDTYQFRRCHAISYALEIIVNLNLIIEQLSDNI